MPKLSSSTPSTINRLHQNFTLENQHILWMDCSTQSPDQQQPVRPHHHLYRIPLFFILHTDKVWTSLPTCHLVLFADNTILLSLLLAPHSTIDLLCSSLLSGGGKISWLQLRTRDMVATFCRRQTELASCAPTIIQGCQWKL